MRTRFLLTMLCLFFPAAVAQAKDVKMGDVTVRIPVPDGYCELDPAVKSDKSLIDVTKTATEGVGNALLLFAANCDELRSWRAGKNPLRLIASYQTGQDRLTTAFSPADAKKTCEDLRGRGQQISEETRAEVEKAVRAASKERDFLGTKVLGVLEEDALGCYAAMVVKSKHQDNIFVQLKVVYVASIKDRMVFNFIEKPYQDGAANVQDLLKDAKRYAAAFRAANGI